MKKIVGALIGAAFISFCIKQIPSYLIAEFAEEATANILEWCMIVKHRLTPKGAK
ncbi:hypothetical protein [Gluconobacter sp. Gdi]|uniref:hypothetical protein n=1 Tax=unclassified Gluconobacter TaxID=2644261 RepID=UPI001764AE9A|nr:hypothetical protein [Gluconobacter sp. Gdi]GFE97483.1 hypothetical protein DmGdi_25560 [Gluconobacter sp. Gdi]